MGPHKYQFRGEEHVSERAVKLVCFWVSVCSVTRWSQRGCHSSPGGRSRGNNPSEIENGRGWWYFFGFMRVQRWELQPGISCRRHLPIYAPVSQWISRRTTRGQVWLLKLIKSLRIMTCPGCYLTERLPQSLEEANSFRLVKQTAPLIIIIIFFYFNTKPCQNTRNYCLTVLWILLVMNDCHFARVYGGEARMDFLVLLFFFWIPFAKVIKALMDKCPAVW